MGEHAYTTTWRRVEKAFGPFVEGSMVPNLERPCEKCGLGATEHKDIALWGDADKESNPHD